MIFILLVCICSISTSKYLGRPPHTGDAYSKIGLIFYIYVVNPISTGRLDLRHSRGIAFYRLCEQSDERVYSI